MAAPNDSIAKIVKTTRPVVKGSLLMLLGTGEEETKENGRTLVEVETNGGVNMGGSSIWKARYPVSMWRLFPLDRKIAEKGSYHHEDPVMPRDDIER